MPPAVLACAVLGPFCMDAESLTGSRRKQVPQPLDTSPSKHRKCSANKTFSSQEGQCVPGRTTHEILPQGGNRSVASQRPTQEGPGNGGAVWRCLAAYAGNRLV